MNLYDKLIHRSISLGTVIGSIALACVMLIIVANVVYRAFGGVIAGTYDLVEITVVIVAAFSIAGTEIHKRHTTVDMITTLLPDRARIWMENGCNVISLIYWAVIAWGSAKIALEKAQLGEVTEYLGVSIIPFRVLWVFGLILVCIVIIYNTYCNLRDLRVKKA